MNLKDQQIRLHESNFEPVTVTVCSVANLLRQKESKALRTCWINKVDSSVAMRTCWINKVDSSVALRTHSC